ncbi:hypothetical protein C0V76_07800 [Uliginosibacterium sp. TH139]|nr:hypothetical protein C0V76_07800 [Uliginosibacterium sp. TH139]
MHSALISTSGCSIKMHFDRADVNALEFEFIKTIKIVIDTLNPQIAVIAFVSHSRLPIDLNLIRTQVCSISIHNGVSFGYSFPNS